MSQIVVAKTNAEFLNHFFGTNHQAFYQSRWPYNDHTWVWMVRMDGKVRDGWFNREVGSDEVWEEFVGTTQPSYRRQKEKEYRIIVKIVDGKCGREYHILGKYRYDFQNSTYKKHVFKKVSEI